MNKKECGHFWEIVFPITIKTIDDKQQFQCRDCGKKKKMKIPIFDVGVFEEKTKNKGE